LLVVVAIVGVLAGLLLPALSGAKGKARRTTCLHNLKQVNLAVMEYAGDNHDTLPAAPDTDAMGRTNGFCIFYKELVKGYVGLKGVASAQDKVFACPADRFFYSYDTKMVYLAESIHDQSWSDYSSYGYNGLGGTTNTSSVLPDQTTSPGLFGWKLGAIRDPVKTILVAELSAFWPFSWHEPRPGWSFNDAQNMVGFADGHVSYIKMYYNTNYYLSTCRYDPPAGYEYKWSGE
jgi:prepilin-type processing-associated H-X9-DG protein